MSEEKTVPGTVFSRYRHIVSLEMVPDVIPSLISADIRATFSSIPCGRDEVSQIGIP